FDAVTTERPYHKALGEDSAVALLKHEAGRALDPKLVATFIDLVPSLTAEARALEVRLGPAPLVPAAMVDQAPGPSSGFENIARAHREIYALDDIAQSRGTSLGIAETMTIIASKLSKIAPWTTITLFLHDPSNDTLTCRFAAGTEAVRLFGRTIASGT